MTDPAAAASTLAELLGGGATDFEEKLATDAASVVVGNAGSGDERDRVEAAIEDGRLAGFAIDDSVRLAAATAAGVTFLDIADGVDHHDARA